MQETGWEDILDEGEKILWQGRPDTRIHVKPSNIFVVLFGLGFAGFALFWMVMAAAAGGGFWVFGLLHFAVGLALALAPIFWGPYKRRRTWYTLTNRRAFIATDLPLRGKQLKSYPITEETVLDYAPGPPATIHFETETHRTSKGRNVQVPIGFERIDNGDKVYRLMRDIQRDVRQSKEG